jgi:hypothetical protein
MIKMNKSFILFIVYGVLISLIGPILTFLHELGHAIFALTFTNGQVEIRIGSFENKHISFKIGRLEVYLNKFSPFVGFVHWSGIPQEKYKRILIHLGGPIASVLVVLLFTILASKSENTYLKIFLLSFIYGSFSQLLGTIIPMTYKHGAYKGETSDGYKVIRVLKEKRIQEKIA